MKVTVCEISDREDYFFHDLIDLDQYLTKNHSTLLLLPDLAFFEWTGYEMLSQKKQLMGLLENQASWTFHLEKLPVEYIIYSKLVVKGNQYSKSCILYDKKSGHKVIREVEIVKHNEENYRLQPPLSVADCVLIEIEGYKIGIALDTELWTTSIADHLAKAGIDILVCPRASSKDSVDQWIRQGQTMAVLSGAYCLSSNKTRTSKTNFHWGGRGWIAEPFTGKLLGSTNNHKRFLTLKLDMGKTIEAKSKFPIKSYSANF